MGGVEDIPEKEIERGAKLEREIKKAGGNLR